jgi:hypothetical protein
LLLVVVAGWRWYLTWLQECWWVRLQAQVSERFQVELLLWFLALLPRYLVLSQVWIQRLLQVIQVLSQVWLRLWLLM